MADNSYFLKDKNLTIWPLFVWREVFHLYSGFAQTVEQDWWRVHDSRMFSVFSCTTSVFSRLSASTKAPCSTVSSSMVAARSWSPLDSSIHAVRACGCSRLFTVSTIACAQNRPLNIHADTSQCSATNTMAFLTDASWCTNICVCMLSQWDPMTGKDVNLHYHETTSKHCHNTHNDQANIVS